MRPFPLAFLLAASCAQPTTTPPPIAALDVAASFDRTWSATIDVLAAMGLPVASSDKASGLISTGMVVISGSEGARTSKCGGFMSSRWATRGEYTILIRPTSAGSSARATARFTSTGGAESDAQPAMPCQSNGAWERGIQLRIKAAAEGAP